jgi:hypothetical protein
MTDHDPISLAGYRLHLLANEYECGHPDAKVLRDIATKLEQDGVSRDQASREDARRRALALLGTPAPPPLNSLPQPGAVIPGAIAERLPVGSVVYRDDVIRECGRRVHRPEGWRPDLASDIEYRVDSIPGQQVSA